MALTDLATVQQIPGMAGLSSAWLTTLIDAASEAIKKFCNLGLESATYTQYYDGKGLPSLILLQWPVTAVTAVYVDPVGYGGQGTDPFPASTLWTEGQQFILNSDASGSKSTKGILTAIAGDGTSATPLNCWNFGDNYLPYGNKLAASRRPYWPVGQKNIKVVYVAGYSPVPADLNFAAASLVASMVRNQPLGGPLTSESLGSYSYTMASRAGSGNLADLTDYAQILRKYREVPF